MSGLGKTCVVVNPLSGGGKIGKHWPDIQSKIQNAIGEFTTVFTEHSGHATQITRNAITSGCTHIVAVGGDGTLSQVVNGFFNDGEAINPSAVLGIISTGTGCDTVRTLNTGAGLDEQINTLKSGVVKSIDLGRVETAQADGTTQTQFFINACSFGLSAEVVSAVNTGNGKSVAGRHAYLLGAIKVLPFRKNRNVALEGHTHKPWQQKVALAVVANGAFCGGGIKLAPMAKLDDGMLDTIIVGDVGITDLILYFKRLLSGRLLEHPKIEHMETSSFSAKLPEGDTTPIEVEADGEPIGFLPCKIDILARSIKVQTRKG